ncbi:hypothetical protein HCB27_17505 [Listeria booriae]|uniref:ABM domain-containing protein n=1 Tax=Listeria booriae TaxID=1552123 RepID=A0A7X0Z9F2_9LIST|nr:antibiotic biosynthesis monooxygenase [Listeria booriae]MBC2178426.1 hypothetical protein [Listeria booriae]
MHIETVSIEFETTNKEKMLQSVAHHREEMADFEGFLGYEVWLKEGARKSTVMNVSRWASKEEFTVWMKQHRDFHREMKRTGGGGGSELVVTRQTGSYDMIEVN